MSEDSRTPSGMDAQSPGNSETWESGNHSPLITIVIPAYTAEKTIAKAIDGALRQQGDFIKEIIVVDDGSSDRTAEIVKSFKEVKYFFQPNAGPAAARNRGAQEAQGEIIFFTDADCIPAEDWLVKAVVHFADPHVAVVSGSYAIANPQERLAKCIHQEIIFRHRNLMPVYPKFFGSFNFAVRKKVFAAVGGFDVGYRTASGEDNDLSYKILRSGGKIYFAKDALVAHHHPSDIKKYLREQFNHGFWRAKMYRHHPRMSRGDDYTFWKDILEPPLVLGICFCFGMLMFLGKVWIYCVLVLLIFILLILEFIFACRIVQGGALVLFWTAVTFYRAFVRTFGFLAGIVRFFSPLKPQKLIKKN